MFEVYNITQAIKDNFEKLIIVLCYHLIKKKNFHILKFSII